MIATTNAVAPSSPVDVDPMMPVSITTMKSDDSPSPMAPIRDKTAARRVASAKSTHPTRVAAEPAAQIDQEPIPATIGTSVFGIVTMP